MTLARPFLAAALPVLVLLGGCLTPERRVPQPEGLSEAHVEAYRRAAVALDAGDPATALRSLDPYLDREPWHVPTHLLLQDALVRADRADDAAARYETLLAEAPEDPARVLLAARTAEGAGRRDGYERTLELDAGSVWARIALAYDLLRARAELQEEGRRLADLGDPEGASSRRAAAGEALARAEQLADEAARLEPELAAAHGVRVDVLLVQCELCAPKERPNRALAAVAAAERAHELAPLDVAVLERLARAYHEKPRDEDAAEALETAVELAPRNFVLRANLGRVLLDLRRDEDALVALEAAHAMRPQDVAVLLNIGVARFRTGDFLGARSTFLQAGDLAPDDPRPIEGLVAVDDELSRRESANVE